MKRWISGLTVAWSIALGPRAARSQADETKPAAARVAPQDVLLGEWWTENNEGRIRFTRDRSGMFRGTSTCCIPKIPTDANPAKDIHNPNPKLRDRSTMGIVIIWKLSYEDGEYTGGYVYSPRDGNVYRIKAEVIDHDTIKIRGYMGIALFGQSQIWKRAVTQDKPPATTR